MEQSENKIYGNLFGTVDLINKDHLEVILSTMSQDQAIFFFVESIKLAYKKNLYTIGEVEVISKAIRVLSDN